MGGREAGELWWRALLNSNTRTGQELRECWDLLQREGEHREQCSNFLDKELDGALEKGPAIASELAEGQSSRQVVTEQREELREAIIREALLSHCL